MSKTRESLQDSIFCNKKLATDFMKSYEGRFDKMVKEVHESGLTPLERLFWYANDAEWSSVEAALAINTLCDGKPIVDLHLGMNILHIATISGKTRFVEALIESVACKNIDINKNILTNPKIGPANPMFLADGNNIFIHGIWDEFNGLSPASIAVKQGNLEMLNLLGSKGANLTHCETAPGVFASPFIEACKLGRLSIVEYIWKQTETKSLLWKVGNPMLAAAESGNAGVIVFIRDNIKDVGAPKYLFEEVIKAQRAMHQSQEDHSNFSGAKTMNIKLTEVGTVASLGPVPANHNYVINGVPLPAEDMPYVFAYIDEKSKVRVIKDLNQFKLDHLGMIGNSDKEIIKFHTELRNVQKQLKKEALEKQAALEAEQERLQKHKEEEKAQKLLEKQKQKQEAADKQALIIMEVEGELIEKQSTTDGCIELLKEFMGLESKISPELRNHLKTAAVKLSSLFKTLESVYNKESAAAAATPLALGLILSQKVDDQGNTLLHKAVFHLSSGNEKMLDFISLLLKNGASADIKNENGYTPLMLSCMNKDSWGATNMLASNSKELSLLDNKGCNVLHHLLKHDISDGKKQAELFKLIVTTNEMNQPGFAMLFDKGTVDKASKTPREIIDSKKGASSLALKNLLSDFLQREKKLKAANLIKTQAIEDQLAEKNATKAKSKLESGDSKVAHKLHDSDTLNKARAEEKFKKAQMKLKIELKTEDLLNSGKVKALDGEEKVEISKPKLMNIKTNALAAEMDMILPKPTEPKKTEAEPKIVAPKQGDGLEEMRKAPPKVKSIKLKKTKAVHKVDALKQVEDLADYDNAPYSGAAHAREHEPHNLDQDGWEVYSLGEN